MQVYSIIHLCFSIIIGMAGVVLLGVNLFALAKKRGLNSYEDIKPVGISLLFMLSGVYWISKALDPPHQESQRTDVIGWVLLPILVATMVSLYLAKHRQPEKPTG